MSAKCRPELLAESSSKSICLGPVASPPAAAAPPPPKFQEADSTLWLAPGDAWSSGSTPASKVTAVASPGIWPSVVRAMIASPFLRSANARTGARSSICCISPPRWPGACPPCEESAPLPPAPPECPSRNCRSSRGSGSRCATRSSTGRRSAAPAAPPFSGRWPFPGPSSETACASGYPR